MSISTALEVMEDRGTGVLNAREDRYGEVTFYLDESMDSTVLASLVESSMSKWRDQGKKVVWIKLQEQFVIEHRNLIPVLVKAGFSYHHTEGDYWILVHWIPNTADTLLANASLHVGNRAYVITAEREGNSINNCLIPRTHALISTALEVMEDRGTDVLIAKEDGYGGVMVNVEKTMDPKTFASWLESSLPNWQDQGKKLVWFKVSMKHENLVEVLLKAGFRYHHAEADYLMLVHRVRNTADTLRANASHCVGIGAFVINDKGEVLVVQDRDGWFKSTCVYKLPTGTVGVGENISAAAIREVKEQTGIDTRFVEVLAFRQSHKTFSQKSVVFFVCMLLALSFDIQTQTSEMLAKWMEVEDYAAQPIVQLTPSLHSVAKICLAKLGGNYTGLAPLQSLNCDCHGYDCESMNHSGCSS